MCLSDVNDSCRRIASTEKVTGLPQAEC